MSIAYLISCARNLVEIAETRPLEIGLDRELLLPCATLGCVGLLRLSSWGFRAAFFGDAAASCSAAGLSCAEKGTELASSREESNRRVQSETPNTQYFFILTARESRPESSTRVQQSAAREPAPMRRKVFGLTGGYGPRSPSS